MPVAALRQRRADFAGLTTAVVLCGANISPQTLKALL